MDTRARVYAAATDLAAEGSNPTVATVRERASCSNADAAAHLRAWRAEQAAALAPALPPLPPQVRELTENAATAAWHAALATARGEHDAALDVARDLVSSARTEADDLAASLDSAQSEAAAAHESHNRTRELLEADIARLTAALAAANTERTSAIGQRDAAVEAASTVRAAQAKAEGLVAGLREAFTALSPLPRTK